MAFWDEIERLFDEDFMPNRIRTKIRQWGEMPVDVYEKENNLMVKIGLAGVKPENIRISVEDKMLRVRAEREKEKEEENRNYYYKEIRIGSLKRLIRLPEEAVPEEAKASFEDGMLLIDVPQREQKEIPEKEEKLIPIEIKSKKKGVRGPD